jgi:hypothetical protein
LHPEKWYSFKAGITLNYAQILISYAVAQFIEALRFSEEYRVFGYRWDI